MTGCPCPYHMFGCSDYPTGCRLARETVTIPRSQYEALMGVKEALEQCVDDFGETGRCVCQQAKQEAIEALASLRSAGIEIEGEKP